MVTFDDILFKGGTANRHAREFVLRDIDQLIAEAIGEVNKDVRDYNGREAKIDNIKYLIREKRRGVSELPVGTRKRLLLS